MDFDLISGSLHRISFNGEVNQAPVIIQAESDVNVGPSPLTINFTGAAIDLESDPLEFKWILGDGEVVFGENISHSYLSNGLFNAFLEVSDGINTTTSDPITIMSGNPPSITITSPTEGSLFRAGDIIDFVGTASDLDESLTDDSFNWTLEFGHNDHTHPGFSQVPGISGTYEIPTTGHDFHDDTSYIFSLTVTDSDGLFDTDFVEIFPDKVDVTYETNPNGLNLFIDDLPIKTPSVHDTLINFQHSISAR